MNYEAIYNTICERGKRRKKTVGSNLEKHHIVPTFFFRDSKRNHRYKDGIFGGDGEHVGNITFLTPREHFIAHLLLCKIWKKTKWEYRCYLSVKMFVNHGKINEIRNVFKHSSRKYEYYRTKANKAISKGKSGTMPAKHYKTGERLGIVNTDHPKVLSGEWVHITKGIKKTKEQRMLYSKSGLENHNSKYTDEDLLESYKQCCYQYGKLVNTSFWASYAEYHGLPYIKFWKDFRFSGRGKKGMEEELIKMSNIEGIEIEKVYFKSGSWRKFVSEEKKKWESK